MGASDCSGAAYTSCLLFARNPSYRKILLIPYCGQRPLAHPDQPAERGSGRHRIAGIYRPGHVTGDPGQRRHADLFGYCDQRLGAFAQPRPVALTPEPFTIRQAYCQFLDRSAQNVDRVRVTQLPIQPAQPVRIQSHGFLLFKRDDLVHLIHPNLSAPTASANLSQKTFAIPCGQSG